MTDGNEGGKDECFPVLPKLNQGTNIHISSSFELHVSIEKSRRLFVIFCLMKSSRELDLPSVHALMYHFSWF